MEIQTLQDEMNRIAQPSQAKLQTRSLRSPLFPPFGKRLSYNNDLLCCSSGTKEIYVILAFKGLCWRHHYHVPRWPSQVQGDRLRICGSSGLPAFKSRPGRLCIYLISLTCQVRFRAHIFHYSFNASSCDAPHRAKRRAGSVTRFYARIRYSNQQVFLKDKTIRLSKNIESNLNEFNRELLHNKS